MIESSLHRPQQQRTAGYGICATREIGEWLTKPKRGRGLPLEARLQVPEEPAERCGRDHVRRHAQPEREGPDELRVAPTLVCTTHGSRRGGAQHAQRTFRLPTSVRDLSMKLGKRKGGGGRVSVASFAEVAASDPTHALMVKTGQGWRKKERESMARSSGSEEGWRGGRTEGCACRGQKGSR